MNKEFKTTEGLEPPMLDETWGLENIETNEVRTFDIQRKDNPNEIRFVKDLNGMKQSPNFFKEFLTQNVIFHVKIHITKHMFR